MSEPQKQPQLPTPVGRWLSGNPFQDETVTFRWLVAVIVAAASVALAGVLTDSAKLAMIWAIVLIVLFAAAIVKVVAYLLGSPDDD